ncbi:MAG: hypothetical protein KIT84_13035 [Labilithrix sp.]|nr:hypothetical protein [Labilithrix sp.]MCW5811940.1 hypothetical protein [Labilithrix sp.]
MWDNIMSGTVNGVLPIPLSSPASVRDPLPTGPQPREIVEAMRLARLALSDELALRVDASKPEVREAHQSAMRLARPAPAKPGPLAIIKNVKKLTDSIPFPVVFVIGALFGVIFASSLVTMTRPEKLQPLAVAPLAEPALIDAPAASPAVVTPAAPASIEMEKQAREAQAASFVAWAAPPALPAAEPQLPATRPTAPAHAQTNTKRSLVRAPHKKGSTKPNTRTAAR